MRNKKNANEMSYENYEKKVDDKNDDVLGLKWRQKQDIKSK